MNSVLANGYSIVTYQRTLKAADELDLPVLTNQSQPIIWAIGPLNSRNEVSYHHHFTKVCFKYCFGTNVFVLNIGGRHLPTTSLYRVT